MRQPSIWIAILISLASCAKAKEPAPDTASLPADVAPPAADSAQPTSAAPAAATPSSSEWVVTQRGIGKLRAGMTVAEARAVLPSFKMRPGADPTGCDYASTEGLPAGVSVMMEQGTIVRVDIKRAGVQTSAGAQVGDAGVRPQVEYVEGCA